VPCSRLREHVTIAVQHGHASVAMPPVVDSTGHRLKTGATQCVRWSDRPERFRGGYHVSQWTRLVIGSRDNRLGGAAG